MSSGRRDKKRGRACAPTTAGSRGTGGGPRPARGGEGCVCKASKRARPTSDRGVHRTAGGELHYVMYLYASYTNSAISPNRPREKVEKSNEESCEVRLSKSTV